jgi:hypothetical protein
MKKKAYNMTVEQIDAATVALNNQRGAMHFLLPVAPELRSKTRRLPSKAIQMADKRLKAAREHSGDLPANFDMRGFERDVLLMKALEQCRDAAARILEEVQDTLNQVGTNASLAGAEAYAHLRASFVASPGLKRTVGGLSARRTKPGKHSAPEPMAAPQQPQSAPAPAPQGPSPVPGPDKKAA